MSMEAVRVKNLSKVFNKKIIAINKVSFTVKEGEIFGFLGPNGAGKTTTIKVLTTLLKPTNGEVIVSSFDVVKDSDAVRKSIGIVPQALTLDDDLKGMANIRLAAKLYHVPDKIAKERIKKLLDMVGLSDAAEREVNTYSGGMRKRLELIIGLVHEPKILFLDEPTLGLDIQTRSVIWKYLKNLNKEKGLTIFITTHYLEEADFLCDRIGIINQGKILIEGSPSKLKEKLGGDIIEILVDKPDEVRKSLEQQNIVKKVDINEQNLRIEVEKCDIALPIILELCNSKGIIVRKASITKPSLDEVFLKYTGKSLRDAESTNADNFTKYIMRRRR